MDEILYELDQEVIGFRLRADSCRELLRGEDGTHRATRLNGKAAAYDHCADLLAATIERIRGYAPG